MARKTLRASEQSCPFQNAICASLRQRQGRTQQRFAIARNPYDLQRQAESVVHHPSRVHCPNANCSDAFAGEMPTVPFEIMFDIASEDTEEGDKTLSVST